MMTLVAASLALAAGAMIGWLLARSSAAGTTGRALAEAEAARQHAGAAERVAAERVAALTDSWEERLADERVAASERAREVRAALEAQHAEALHATRLLAERDREAAAEQLARERATHAELLERERNAARSRLEELRADTKRLSDEFAALSRQALTANSEQFLAAAEERLKRTQSESAAELAKREEAVRQLVEPLAKTLDDVKSEMTTSERSRVEAHAALAEQVKTMRESSDQLRGETSQLVTALRAPQVRGRWGELQLRRVIEVAGMVSHVDFEEQATVAGEDGVFRPDVIVKLPGEKQIVVDSKVAFAGYLEAMEAKDDETRAKRLDAHARHLRKHIDDLGSKAYWEQVAGTPEFVIMFVPAEVFLDAALERDPTLYEHAFGKNVVIATPSNLVALLRTVGFTWRQEMLTAEAQQVLDVGRELHKRLAVMGRHLDSVAKKLNATVLAFNQLNSSLDTRVVTQARKFSALQGLEPALDAPTPLDVLAVPAHKEDLFADEVDAGGTLVEIEAASRRTASG